MFRFLAALALACALSSPAWAHTFDYVAPAAGFGWAVAFACVEAIVIVGCIYTAGLRLYERARYPSLVAMGTVAVILLAGAPVLADPACDAQFLDGKRPVACLVAPVVSLTYPATLVRVVDGDTAIVSVPAWAATPFGTISVRIAGIDAPEGRKPPAKCKAEVVLGKAASAYAKGFAKPGDAVVLTYRGLDKYARVDGALALSDGRDWATVMLGAGMARPYAGGTKSSWCRKAPTSGL